MTFLINLSQDSASCKRAKPRHISPRSRAEEGIGHERYHTRAAAGRWSASNPQATAVIASPQSMSALEATTVHRPKIAHVPSEHSVRKKLREQIALCQRLEWTVTDDDFQSRLRVYLSNLEAQWQTVAESEQHRPG